MMQRKLRIFKLRDPIVTIKKRSREEDQMVYIILANKPVPYERGKSRIVYVGSTRKGISRIVASGAQHADEVLKRHGQKELNIVPVICKQEQGLASWKFLEHAILYNFLEMYGGPPLCNKQGKGYRERKEHAYFGRDRIRQIIKQFENNKKY